MDVQVRFARTEDELAAIYRLRYATYVEELHLYTSQADHTRRWLADAEDAAAHQLYAEVEGQVVGTLRLHLGGTGAIPASLATRFELERFSPQVPVESCVSWGASWCAGTCGARRCPTGSFRRASAFSSSRAWS